MVDCAVFKIVDSCMKVRLKVRLGFSVAASSLQPHLLVAHLEIP